MQRRKDRRENGDSSEAICHPVDSVLDKSSSEVDHQCESHVREAQVGQRLGFEHRIVVFGRLALDDDFVGNNQIDS